MSKQILRTCVAVGAMIMMALTTAQPAGAHPGGGGNTHSFDLSGSIRIVDADWPDADDIGTFSFTGFRDFTAPTPPGQFVPAHLSRSSFCVDEVRVELAVWMRLEASGAGQYYASARLYEGVSCSTTDFGGSGSVNITHLFVNACHARQFTVRNDWEDADDFATITFRIEQDHQILMQRC